MPLPKRAGSGSGARSGTELKCHGSRTLQLQAGLPRIRRFVRVAFVFLNSHRNLELTSKNVKHMI
jgi:hypothetical protein